MNINSVYAPIAQSASTSATATSSNKSAANFADILQGQKKMAADKNMSVDNSSQANWRNVDFTNLTPKQMRTISADMRKSGAIDFDAMTSLQMIGPLGKVGPNGEFVPFTSAEREQIDNTPINYSAAVSQQRANIERMGRTLDPTSGYAMWAKLEQLLGQAKSCVGAKV
ncbi:hypothetical protein [Shewanella dokdonensis]|uniref:Uncharacterized protein n=1 Tax=Shewanella dokdonensis TaxID=712036 RepID=A0ABX8DCS5_9GAMM|nr:hypothetical protein [Shewanella dokdonensis]MCL1074639.1 hypothetical protein [Shewanella dokdonensis]QVK22363.1 hypothetical protein KHX94_13290 [Shewanella dokdonensis]